MVVTDRHSASNKAAEARNRAAASAAKTTTTTTSKSYTYTRSDGTVGKTTDYRHSDANKAAEAMNRAASGTGSVSEAQTYVNRALSSGGISASAASAYSAALSSGNLGSTAKATQQTTSLTKSDGTALASVNPVSVTLGSGGYNVILNSYDKRGYGHEGYTINGKGIAYAGIEAEALRKYYLDKADKAAKNGDTEKANELYASAAEMGAVIEYKNQHPEIEENYGAGTGKAYEAWESPYLEYKSDGSYEVKRDPSKIYTIEGYPGIGKGTMTHTEMIGESFIPASTGLSSDQSAGNGATTAAETAAQTKAETPAQSGIIAWLVNKLNYVKDTAQEVTGGNTPTNAWESINALSETSKRISSDLGDKYIDWTENSLGVDDEGNLKVNDALGLAAYVVTPATAYKVAKRTLEGRGSELETLDYAQAGLDLIALIPGAGWAIKGVEALTKVGGKTALKVGTKALAKTGDDVVEAAAKGAKAADVVSSASKLEETALKTSTLASKINKVSSVSTGVSLAGTAALVGYAVGDALTSTDASPDTGDINPSTEYVYQPLPEAPYAAEPTMIIDGAGSGGEYYEEYYEEPEGGTGGSVAIIQAQDAIAKYGPYVIAAMIIIGLLVLFSSGSKSKTKTTRKAA